jgi:hypothetical protein
MSYLWITKILKVWSIFIDKNEVLTYFFLDDGKDFYEYSSGEMIMHQPTTVDHEESLRLRVDQARDKHTEIETLRAQHETAQLGMDKGLQPYQQDKLNRVLPAKIAKLEQEVDSMKKFSRVFGHVKLPGQGVNARHNNRRDWSLIELSTSRFTTKPTNLVRKLLESAAEIILFVLNNVGSRL